MENFIYFYTKPYLYLSCRANRSISSLTAKTGESLSFCACQCVNCVNAQRAAPQLNGRGNTGIVSVHEGYRFDIFDIIFN